MAVEEIVRDDGTREWREDGLLHRDGDLPAVVLHDGTKFWYQDGKLYRDGDLPAVVYFDGPMSWWQDGEMYRSYNLPFSVEKDGSVIYKGSRREYTPDEIVSVKYEGIEYSVPHWLLEGHSASREESEA